MDGYARSLYECDEYLHPDGLSTNVSINVIDSEYSSDSMKRDREVAFPCHLMDAHTSKKIKDSNATDSDHYSDDVYNDVVCQEKENKGNDEHNPNDQEEEHTDEEEHIIYTNKCLIMIFNDDGKEEICGQETDGNSQMCSFCKYDMKKGLFSSGFMR